MGGDWLIEHVSERYQSWIHQGIQGPLQYLSINISPKQFYQREFEDNTLFLSEDHGLDPNRIVLEITEGTLLKDIDNAVLKMTKLKKLVIACPLMILAQDIRRYPI
ncbi:MAG: EAL domain-containing protein [Motiliproteus sp.]|nr:EAL domain-containing protein [Motiliproteus sp.]MCW9054283.1 EAL domain-containing protein [Motiliproteus sp.]